MTPPTSEARAPDHRVARQSTPVPGLWAAGAAALASCLFIWLWALPQLSQSAPAAQPGAALALSEVPQGELSAASAMLDAAPALQAKLRQEKRQCGAHLAMVTAMRAPGTTGEVALRFRSGSWFSPLFKVGETPLRIPVPFPAPYATGHGTIIVGHAGAGAVLSLAPTWHLSGPDGQASHAVSWVPDRNCPPVKGGAP